MNIQFTTQPQPDPLFLSIPEVARKLGCGQTLTWALLRDKKLPCVKIGRRTVVSTQALLDFAANLTATSSGR